MFVIADNRGAEPVFLWKVSHGTTFITHNITQAQQFTTRKQADYFLTTLRPDSTFEFKVHVLGIIA